MALDLGRKIKKDTLEGYRINEQHARKKGK